MIIRQQHEGLKDIETLKEDTLRGSNKRLSGNTGGN